MIITLFLSHYSLSPREFNSYGSRRGNDAVMVRGTFANIRLLNKFIGKAAPKTVYIPTGEVVSDESSIFQVHMGNNIM